MNVDINEDVLKTYSFPIARMYGNIARATSDELLEAILRCAEVTSRYFAALAIASFAARADQDINVPVSFTNLKGALSWGKFLQVIREVALSEAVHPIRSLFDGCLLPTSVAYRHLDTLASLRNRKYHNLAVLNAKDLLEGYNPASEKMEFPPQQRLDQILTATVSLCTLPLFHVENIAAERKIPHVRLHFLMDENGYPRPKMVAVSEPFTRNGLYVGLKQGALSLHSLVVWEPQSDTGIAFFDNIETSKPEKAVAYNNICNQPPRRVPKVSEILPLLQGTHIPLEIVQPYGSRNFHDWWYGKSPVLTPTLPKHSVPRPIWDEASVLRYFSNNFGVQAAEVVKVVADWAQAGYDAQYSGYYDEIETFHAWGDGETDATLIVCRRWHTDQNPETWKEMTDEGESFASYFTRYAMLIVHEDGMISFRPDQFPMQFDKGSETWICNFVPELLRSLYLIVEVPLPKTIERSTLSLPISAFADSSKVERLRQAFDHYLDQLKGYLDNLPPGPTVPGADEL